MTFVDWSVFVSVYMCLGVCARDQSHQTLGDPMDCSQPGSSVHGIFPSKNTRVGCHFLLQGIFPTQGISQPRGLNLCLLGLLIWQADSLPLRYLGSPAILPSLYFFFFWHISKFYSRCIQSKKSTKNMITISTQANESLEALLIWEISSLKPVGS